MPGDPSAPTTVRVAGGIVGLEGLGGLAFAVALLVQPGVLRPSDRYGEAAFFAILAAAVIGFGIALVLGKRGARSPVVVIQLLLLAVAGYATVPSGRPEYGIPVAVACLAVLYLLLNPRARDWVMDRTGSDKEPD
ncbi:hypothetical protein [Actinophytocola sp.]|uniref:hypothetical protein n=1 Tax=Actinophytocola sp. TaxID=1872138 RepID=UPI00389992DC